MKPATAHLHICATCASSAARAAGGLLPGAALLRAVRALVRTRPLARLEVHGETCLGPCDKPCAAVLHVPGRRTFIAVELQGPVDAEVLLTATMRGAYGDGRFIAELPGRSRAFRGWVE